MTGAEAQPSDSVLMLLCWLVKHDAHIEGRVCLEELVVYYERNGRGRAYAGSTDRAITLSRRGAAGRMLRRLYAWGYVERGDLTEKALAVVRARGSSEEPA